MLEIVCCLTVGYLIGSVNPAFLIGKIKGFDIRKRGSGNAGASNAVITMGKTVGFLSAVFDIFKAFLVSFVFKKLFPAFALAGVLSGVSCIIGHIFPLFMGFRGGKGLATLGGVILAFDYRVFLILLLLEAILAVLVNYICVVPITASIVFPFIYYFMTRDWIGAVIYALVAVVIICKHIENLRRIRNGTEARFSFLWQRKKEIERLGGEDDSN